MATKSRQRLIIEARIAGVVLLVSAVVTGIGRAFHRPEIGVASLPIMILSAIIIFRAVREWKNCTDPLTEADEQLNTILGMIGSALFVAPWFVLALVLRTQKAWLLFVAMLLLTLATWLSLRWRRRN
jgi:hypothetical protein